MEKRILVDVFNLRVAQTGVRTYTEEFCHMIETSDSRRHHYKIVPDFKRVTQSSFFHGKTGKLRNLLYHIIYFFWKQICLPLIAKRFNADVIFCPDFVAPAIKTRALKVPVVHDAFFWERPEYYNSHWLKYFKKMITAGLRGKSLVVTTSNYSADRLSNYLPGSVSKEVVYQGSRFEHVGELGLSSHWSLQPKCYFLHVGVLEKRKNLLTLIRAFRLFISENEAPDVKLVLAGQRGPRADMDDFESITNEISNLGLDFRVILTGYVTKEELESLYQHALCYVFPSTDEGFGLPILEAFSYSLPVIVSRNGALPEVGGEAVVTFATNDPQDLASKLNDLYSSEPLRNELVHKGALRLKQFSWQIFFQSLERVFDKA